MDCPFKTLFSNYMYSVGLFNESSYPRSLGRIMYLAFAIFEHYIIALSFSTSFSLHNFFHFCELCILPLSFFKLCSLFFFPLTLSLFLPSSLSLSLSPSIALSSYRSLPSRALSIPSLFPSFLPSSLPLAFPLSLYRSLLLWCLYLSDQPSRI